MALLSRAAPAPVVAPVRRAAAAPATPLPRAIIAGRRAARLPAAAALSPAGAPAGPLGAAPVVPVAPVPAPAAPAAGGLDSCAALQHQQPRASVIPHAAAATAVAALDAAVLAVVLEAAAALDAPALAPEPTCATAAGGAAAAGGPRSSSGVAAPGGGGLLTAAGRVLLSPYRAYARALDTRPLLTKACTSCVGFMLGDLLAQHLAGGDLEAARVLRLGLYGLALDGPLGGLWYDLLEAKVGPDRPTAATTVLAKTALDQVVYASLGTALFFTTVTLLEGRPGDVAGVLQSKVVPTLVANWAIWPAAHIVNFRFVPSQLRIAYNNVVAIGWLALLSAITHSSGSLLAHIPGLTHHHC